MNEQYASNLLDTSLQRRVHNYGVIEKVSITKIHECSFDETFVLQLK